MTKMEEQVKENSIALEEILGTLIPGNENKWVAFHKGKYVISETFKTGYDAGIKQFGYNTGFALKKLTKEPAVVSDLVEL